MTDYNKELGSYLRKWRQRSGLTQKYVATSIGYTSAQAISNIERGIVKPPKNKKLKIYLDMINAPSAAVIDRWLDCVYAELTEKFVNSKRKK